MVSYDSEERELGLESLRRRFRDLRERRHLTQKEAGELIDLSRNTIQGFESGTAFLREKSLSKIRHLIEIWSVSRAREEPVSYSVGEKLICPNCGNKTASPRQDMVSPPLFCSFCGGKIAVKCIGCGHLELLIDSRFCRKCGVEFI